MILYDVAPNAKARVYRWFAAIRGTYSDFNVCSMLQILVIVLLGLVAFGAFRVISANKSTRAKTVTIVGDEEVGRASVPVTPREPASTVELDVPPQPTPPETTTMSESPAYPAGDVESPQLEQPSGPADKAEAKVKADTTAKAAPVDPSVLINDVELVPEDVLARHCTPLTTPHAYTPCVCV